MMAAVLAGAALVRQTSAQAAAKPGRASHGGPTQGGRGRHGGQDDHAGDAVSGHRLLPPGAAERALVAGDAPGPALLRRRHRPRGRPPATPTRSPASAPTARPIAADYPSESAWDTAHWPGSGRGGSTPSAPTRTTPRSVRQMPYEVQLSMATGDDWFAPSFVTNADQIAATPGRPRWPTIPTSSATSPTASSTGAAGRERPETRCCSSYLALPPGSPGLAVAQQYVGNPDGFVTALATRYFQVTTAAVKMYDTNHLILGVKAEGQEIQPELLEAAAPYVDVFSIDDYNLARAWPRPSTQIWPYYLPVDPNLADFEQYLNKPIMIGEYSARRHTPQTPEHLPGHPTATTPPNSAAPPPGELHRPPLRGLALGGRATTGSSTSTNPRADASPTGRTTTSGWSTWRTRSTEPMVTAMQVMHSIAPDRLGQTGSDLRLVGHRIERRDLHRHGHPLESNLPGHRRRPTAARREAGHRLHRRRSTPAADTPATRSRHPAGRCPGA